MDARGNHGGNPFCLNTGQENLVKFYENCFGKLHDCGVTVDGERED